MDSDHAERLRRMRRAADYPLTILLINPLNRRLVRPLARAGVAPNAVTGASFGLAVVAGIALYYAAQGRLWAVIAAPLLAFASHVCDALDGDLARYADRQSELGAYFDPTLDRARELIYAFSVGAGLYRLEGGAAPWIAAMCCLGAVLLYFYTTDAQVARALKARPNDPRRYSVLLGSEESTRMKLGIYEPFMYGLAIATSAGAGYWALWILAAMSLLAWLAQLVKLYRICTQ